MNKYTITQGVNLARRKSEAILDDLSFRVAGSGDAEFIISELKKSVRTFFEKLESPISEPLILTEDQPRSLAEYENYLNSVRHDLEILFDSAVSATALLSESFNYVSLLTSSVSAKAERLASLSEDLSLISDTPVPSVYVAGDRFVDDSKIDRHFSNTVEAAELSPGGGAVTLGRSGLNKVVSPETTRVDVSTTPDFPYDPTKLDDPSKDYRVYEGRYFAYANQMEPAGGVIRWSRTQVDIDNRELEPGVVTVSSNESGPDAEARRDELNRIINSRVSIVQDTPTLNELNSVRGRMFDGSPSTYWQIEATFNPFSLTDELRFRESIAGLTPSQSANILRGVVKSVDTRDFDVTLTIDLGKAYQINFINLVPENFGEEAWLEIINLDTSTSKDGKWYEIEGLFSHKYENVLTPDANLELTNEEVKATMSPSRYSYGGQGVFTFPPREARFIRIGLRQKVPVPAPYHVIRYKLVRHATTTITRTRKVGLFE